MSTYEEFTKDQVKATAQLLGVMLAQGVGDFYDVAESLADGYGSINNGPEHQGYRKLVALHALTAAAEEVKGWVVEDAREALMPWSKIGEALDMSKQAAQQRWGKPAG